MPSAKRVRVMAPEDRDAIVDMISALTAYEAVYSNDRSADPEVSSAYLAHVEEEVASEGGVVLVVEVPGVDHPVGFASVVYQSDDPYIVEPYRRYAYVTDVFIVEAYRRRGFGRMLMKELERSVKAAGIHRIIIGALADNVRTRDAYARLGFRPYVVEFVKDLGPGLQSSDERL